MKTPQHFLLKYIFFKALSFDVMGPGLRKWEAQCTETACWLNADISVSFRIPGNYAGALKVTLVSKINSEAAFIQMDIWHNFCNLKRIVLALKLQCICHFKI